MTWKIVTDSSCDWAPESPACAVSSVPFIISAGHEDFMDDAALQVPAMLDAMERCEMASHTSCPTPQAWLEEFEQADRCIAITISSRLSGSMNSAQIARELALERAPEKRIAVLDSRSTGPEIALCVEAMQGWIAQGMDFEGVVRAAGRFLQKTHIAFALSSFDNFIKNGRMSRAVGFLAHKLGMWGIGAGSDEGEIAVRGKTRGPWRAIGMLIAEMQEKGFCGGRVAIDHCCNPDFAEKLRAKILEHWENARVSIHPTRGLCGYYAQRHGVIVAYGGAG